MKPAPINKVAVFCGSATGKDPAFSSVCAELVLNFRINGISLVYGGGNVGLMGILADEMLKQGGEVIGVIPQKLVDIEVAHHGLTHLHIVKDMHERKALIAKLSDAFIVLPGGIGTMEEFFEMYTWLQLGYHKKPVALLNLNGFYNMLIGFLEHIVQQGFFQKDSLAQLIIEDHPKDLVDRIIKS
jgi:uncharacterized protein (TIGR00730 family)